MGLLDAGEARLGRAVGGRGFGLLGGAGFRGDGLGGRFADLEGHTLPVFAGVDGGDVVDGDGERLRDAAEAGLAGDEVVAHVQVLHGLGAEVEHDLAVAHVLARHQGVGVDLDGDVGREALVDAPLVEGAQQVGLGGYDAHGLGAVRARGRPSGA